MWTSGTEWVGGLKWNTLMAQIWIQVTWAKTEFHWSERDRNRWDMNSEILQWKCVSVRQTHALFRTLNVRKASRYAQRHLALYFLSFVVMLCVSLLDRIGRHTHLLSITAVLLRHWWGTSGAGFFFRVSMIDWTPRFTLDVTRRVTESLGGGVEEPVFSRHFWYRN